MVHMSAKAAIYLVVVSTMSACGTVDRVSDWWRGEGAEAPRLQPGTVEYVCEGSKIFQMRMDSSTQSAWVRFPDREFRLDPVPGAVAGRYTNGRTTLNIKDDDAFLTEGTTVSYANCKRAVKG